MHAPYHKQFEVHHFEGHLKERLNDADTDGNEELTHEEFVKLVDLIVDDHLEETKGTECIHIQFT